MGVTSVSMSPRETRERAKLKLGQNGLTWIVIINNAHVHNDSDAARLSDAVLHRFPLVTKDSKHPHKITLQVGETLIISRGGSDGSCLLFLSLWRT